MPAATKSVETMQDVLASVIRSDATTAKESADKTAAAPNPPTNGPGGGAMEGESHYTEGARSAENEAAIRESLGETGTEGAPGPDASKGEINQEQAAATVATTGEDPESESNKMEPAAEAEPGTSVSELSLTSKVSAWQEDAADLITDLVIQKKLAANREVPEFAKEKLAEKTAETSGEGGEDTAKEAEVPEAGDKTAEYGDDPYLELAEGNEELAKAARQAVHDTLIEAHLEGEKLASQALGYLEAMSEEQEGQDLQKSAMGDMEGEKEEAPAESPAPEAPPTEAAPEPAPAPAPEAGMEGGGEADAEAAIIEMAAQLGMSPEELLMLLEQELAGGGDAAGDGASQAVPAAAAPGPEAAMPEAKLAACQDKLAAYALVGTEVQKRASEVLLEMVKRGKRA